KNLLIFGPNGAGKTWIINGLLTMKNIVLNGGGKDSASELAFNPFALDEDSRKGETSFTVDLLIDSVQYRYRFDYNANAITYESLDIIKRNKGNSRYPWLDDSDLDSDMFTNTEVNYKNAWKMFRKIHTAGVPKFKRKSRPIQSYSTSNHYSSSQVAAKGGLPSLYNGSIHFTEDDQHLQLPKLGKVKIKLTRPLPTNSMIRIATVTIKHYPSGKWFVSLLLKSDKPFNTQLPRANSEVGIDLNTDNFLTTNDGQTIRNPRYYRTIKKRLAKEQRILSRRYRRAKKEHRSLWNSKNYQKQKLIVARLYEKVRNQRINFLHQVSTALIKNHDLVVAEDLKCKNMLKSHALAMSISDVGWRTLLTFLEYKAPKYGRTFVEINPAYTTQTCNHCGFRMGTNDTQKLTLKDRTWKCPHCGMFHVRDQNAAQNILAKGHLELAKPLTEDSPIYR
ncbi:RNA-guided endonuclease TnpB family protein, partial [Limosilactobacillus mucosae]